MRNWNTGFRRRHLYAVPHRINSVRAARALTFLRGLREKIAKGPEAPSPTQAEFGFAGEGK